MVFHITEAIHRLHRFADDEIAPAAAIYTQNQIQAILEHPWTSARVKVVLIPVLNKLKANAVQATN